MQASGRYSANTPYTTRTRQLLAGSFMDYPMPRADWMRSIACDEHPCRPRRTRSVEGVGDRGLRARWVHAERDRRRAAAAGIADVDMPVTPDRMWRRCARPNCAKLFTTDRSRSSP